MPNLGRVSRRNPWSRPTETDPGPNRSDRTREMHGVFRLRSCFPCAPSDCCTARSTLVRGSRRLNAKLAPFLCERCSRSSAFRLEASEFPLKARYSGGVWGGEGAQGNRMSVTETPGRRALWGTEGAIRGRPGSPGAGLRRRVVGCVGSILNVHFREYRTFSGQQSAAMTMPFV